MKNSHESYYFDVINEVLDHEYPYTMYWVMRLLEDPAYQDIRFKRLKSYGMRFNLPNPLLDLIEEEEEFLTSESDRLPLFIGTQFGINPNIETLGADRVEGQKIAILAKSALSGVVACLNIHFYTEGKLLIIKRFDNTVSKDPAEYLRR